MALTNSLSQISHLGKRYPFPQRASSGNQKFRGTFADIPARHRLSSVNTARWSCRRRPEFSECSPQPVKDKDVLSDQFNFKLKLKTKNHNKYVSSVIVVFDFKIKMHKMRG